ncbi:uncharacterized protein [Polyergus mexicanus]|uniref:uncharacterized protein n=1 Tax=Polyergus mexicanus TaxID=615972 RepID=UPI0038B64381
MCFKSKIGLSQHERHARPKTRNAKKAAEAEQPAEVGGRKLTVWTVEELEQLSQFSAVYCHEKNVNVRLMEFFSGKTNKQISDARRRLETTVALNPQPDTVPVQPMPAEASTINAEPLEQGPAPRAEHMECEDWKDGLKTKIKVKYDIPSRWRDLAARMVEITDLGTTTCAIDSVCEALSEELTKEEKPTKTGVRRSSKCRHKKSYKTLLPNRVDKRRYAFAKCQELMNNCPKKLADAVAANDLSLLQLRPLPDTARTRELYSNLWGTIGPQQQKATSRMAVDVPTSKIFLPITPKEVECKIKRIAGSSAAGIDGIRKGSLKGKGTSIILARLFNLLLLKEVYPLAWKQNRTTLIPKAGKDPSDVKNWRPITISSMVGRIFSSLLDRRIRDVIQQTQRQKGFIKENNV